MDFIRFSLTMRHIRPDKGDRVLVQNGMPSNKSFLGVVRTKIFFGFPKIFFMSAFNAPSPPIVSSAICNTAYTSCKYKNYKY